MNSKLAIFALVAAFCVLAASAIPIAEEDGLIEDRGPRHRRVTCDLLSASVKGIELNHAACAANCLVQGFKGGRCRDGVCHCRR